MATNATRAEKRTDVQTDVRPGYIPLGIDQTGSSHLWDRHTDTVHIIHEDGGRKRKLLGNHSIEEYVATVGDAFADRVTIE
jgi:hypothetical protein